MIFYNNFHIENFHKNIPFTNLGSVLMKIERVEDKERDWRNKYMNIRVSRNKVMHMHGHFIHCFHTSYYKYMNIYFWKKVWITF